VLGEGSGVAATAALMARAVRREMAQPLSLSLFGFIELRENWICGGADRSSAGKGHVPGVLSSGFVSILALRSRAMVLEEIELRSK
jgi:hypothetical protein